MKSDYRLRRGIRSPRQALFSSDEGCGARTVVKKLVEPEGQALIYARIITTRGERRPSPGSSRRREKGPLGTFARILSPLRIERPSALKGWLREIGRPHKRRRRFTSRPDEAGLSRLADSKGIPRNSLQQGSREATLRGGSIPDGASSDGRDGSHRIRREQHSVGQRVVPLLPTRKHRPLLPLPVRKPNTLEGAPDFSRRFNEQGLDAAIASTFSLEDTFAKHSSRHSTRHRDRSAVRHLIWRPVRRRPSRGSGRTSARRMRTRPSSSPSSGIRT